MDSGILLASVLDEVISEKSKAILKYWEQENFRFAAPVLFRYEIVAVARKAVHRKRSRWNEELLSAIPSLPTLSRYKLMTPCSSVPTNWRPNSTAPLLMMPNTSPLLNASTATSGQPMKSCSMRFGTNWIG